MKFTNAIVKQPCINITKGLSKSSLGFPDYELALEQHIKYREALEQCGVKVTILESDDNYPDSTFVEDTAVLTKDCAIITNPGALSRKGEIKNIIPAVEKFYSNIEYIKSSGTVDGGDILNVDNFYYIGLSKRTNVEGAQQFINILKKYGMNGKMVEMNEMLHLKSGIAYLGNNDLVVAGEFINNQMFKDFNKIKISENETYAANCININDTIFLPKGYDNTRKMIESFGYKTLTLDMSEVQKVDGGLSCLSLRFCQK